MMKSEKEVRISLDMHREALSYTKEQFKSRLKELVDAGEIDINPDEEEVVKKLFKEMRHIERAIIRELEWVLDEELMRSEEWVKSILDNL